MSKSQEKIKLNQKLLEKLEINFIYNEQRFLRDKNKTETEKVNEQYILIEKVASSKSIL
ncbi:hypothetical protein [uncultured Dialister sp.]|jgi:hypothetical protein|uniref:hypothetical protein n=1 Tax=uncultured Dialister sp. TaxID=278064 RepID=UPI00258796F1|nr:hypothetical protein [uncultured Dialister sp.]